MYCLRAVRIVSKNTFKGEARINCIYFDQFPICTFLDNNSILNGWKRIKRRRTFASFISLLNRLIVMLRSEAWVKMSRSRRSSFPKMQNFALDRTCNEFDLAKEGRANERRTNRALKQPLVGQGRQVVF